MKRYPPVPSDKELVNFSDRDSPGEKAKLKGIKIIGTPLSPDMKIEIDGVDWTNEIRSLHLTMEAGEPPRLILELAHNRIMDEVLIDTEAIVEVVAQDPGIGGSL